MTEERTTETVTPEGTHHTERHVTHDDAPRSGGGGMWVLLIILLIAVIAGIWIFSSQSGAEIAKDNAIAGAAENVGEAANQVGEAATQAGDAVENTADGE
ncbi:MAG: hypothetical protein ACR2FJ_01330 [Qipengyuania sp.]